MFHVTRSANGEIFAISRDPQSAGEVLDDRHPDIRAFLNEAGGEPVFTEMDADFVRVIEDVIDTLIKNNVMRLTDLPAIAQKKLMARKGARNKLGGALDLLDSDDIVI
ncbi:MAG: hypothetical protein RIS34_138 [Pseudomonadota bacterium]|jgi:nitrogenase molybdenum-iron protein alpha/beta subunit